MASLSTRKDGTREVYIVLDGFRRKVQLGAIPKKDAQSVMAKIEHLASKKLSGGSPDDVVSTCLGVLVEFIGTERDIIGLTVGNVSEFESFGRKRGFSEAHQRTHNRYAKQLFAFAVDHEWLSTNPCGFNMAWALQPSFERSLFDGHERRIQQRNDQGNRC